MQHLNSTVTGYNLIQVMLFWCHITLHNYTAHGSAGLESEGLVSTTSFILPLIMKAREYCCCAIPLVHAGIYITLAEQVFVSLLIGIISLTTPSSKYYDFKYLSLYADDTFFKLLGQLRPHLHP